MLEQLGNVMEIVKKIQQNVSNVEEQLKNERIETTSGDVVKVIMNGQQNLVAIEINPKYFNPDNIVLVQDLIVATVNNATIKSRELHQAAMSKMAGDLNLPKIPGLF